MMQRKLPQKRFTVAGTWLTLRRLITRQPIINQCDQSSCSRREMTGQDAVLHAAAPIGVSSVVAAVSAETGERDDAQVI